MIIYGPSTMIQGRMFDKIEAKPNRKADALGVLLRGATYPSRIRIQRQVLTTEKILTNISLAQAN